MLNEHIERLRRARDLALVSLITDQTIQQQAATTLRDAQCSGTTTLDYLRARLYLQAIPMKGSDDREALPW